MKLVVFDIETTGLDREKDHIVQFSAVKYDSENPSNTETYTTYIQPEGSYNMSITAYVKHRISPEFLKDKPKFADVAQDILDFFEGCSLLTYNGLSFDAPFLKREFKEVGIEWNFSEVPFYDSFLEEKRRSSHKLEDTYFLEAIKCYPKDRKFLSKCSANCKNYLIKQLDIIKPKIILSLGDAATRSILNFKYDKFKDVVGQTFEINGYNIIPIYHPSPVSPMSYKGNIEIFKSLNIKGSDKNE